jgi:hypothetical protein
MTSIMVQDDKQISTHKSAKKSLPSAVFAAFLAKFMHDSLYLDA